MDLRGVTYLLLGGAAASGILYARRVREHWPVAAFLSLVLAKSLIRTAIAPLIVTDGPLTGWHRALFHVEEALFLLGPIGMVTVAFIVFGVWPWRRALTVFGGVWANVVGAAAVGYPFLRGEALRTFYLAVEIASLLLAVFSGLRRRVPASPTVLCVLLIVGVEFTVMLLGPWSRGLFGAEAWALAQAGYCALYMILIHIQAGALWIRS